MEINSAKPLFGYTSEATAYLIEDYPYGFTLRCQKKVWIETDPKRGQRTVEMSSNPKRAGLHWNTPKKSTCDSLCAAFIVEASDVDGKKYTQDDVGHVKFMRIGDGGDVAFLERYNAMYRPFETEYERKTMRVLLAQARAEARLGEYNPPGNYVNVEERAACIAYDKERQEMRQQYVHEELARIKAADEVPEPKAKPVVLAQDVVPAGAMSS